MYSCSASILRTKAQICTSADKDKTPAPDMLVARHAQDDNQTEKSYTGATVLGLLHSNLTETETETHKLKHLLSSVFTMYRGYIDVLDSSCVLQLLESQSHLFMTLIVFIVMKNISPIYPLI